MRPAYLPMNTLGPLGRPGEALVPGAAQHGMRAGANAPIESGLTTRRIEGSSPSAFLHTSSTCRRTAREAR